MKQSPGHHSSSSKDDDDLNPELPAVKDPIRVTEHNILVLLSRVSYAENPSEHLVNSACLGTFMDYVIHAENPFPKCSRILLRLTTNSLCFGPMILCLGPSLIFAKLCRCSYSMMLRSQHNTQSKTGDEKEPEKPVATRGKTATDKQPVPIGSKTAAEKETVTTESHAGTDETEADSPARKKLKLDVGAAKTTSMRYQLISVIKLANFVLGKEWSFGTNRQKLGSLTCNRNFPQKYCTLAKDTHPRFDGKLIGPNLSKLPSEIMHSNF